MRTSTPPRGVQIKTPSLRSVEHDERTLDRYTGASDYGKDEDGHEVSRAVIRSSVKLPPKLLDEMRHKAEVWKAGDHDGLLGFIQDQALMAIQIGAYMMTAEYTGPQANNQRLASINVVIKEGKELVDMVRKIRGLKAEHVPRK